MQKKHSASGTVNVIDSLRLGVARQCFPDDQGGSCTCTGKREFYDLCALDDGAEANTPSVRHNYDCFQHFFFWKYPLFSFCFFFFFDAAWGIFMCSIKKILLCPMLPGSTAEPCVVPAFDEVLPSFDRECQLRGSVVNLGAIVAILETCFLVGFVAGI